MAKKGTKENPVTAEDLAAIHDAIHGENKRPYRIIEATIKDGLCHYSYEMTEGNGPYDEHKVKGKGYIKDDMRTAFDKLRVHMAAIDGVFKLQGIEDDDIDKHHTDDIVLGYHIDGFKMKGSEEQESIVLIGSKPIQECGSRMGIETPKIDITSSSAYKWYNELKALADKVREEVALYKEGKYTVPDSDTQEDDPNQLEISWENDVHDDTFENAQL